MPILVALKLDYEGMYQWHSFYGTEFGSGEGIAVDGAGNIYVVGVSIDLGWDGPLGEEPIHPYYSEWNVFSNAFVLKLNDTNI